MNAKNRSVRMKALNDERGMKAAQPTIDQGSKKAPGNSTIAEKWMRESLAGGPEAAAEVLALLKAGKDWEAIACLLAAMAHATTRFTRIEVRLAGMEARLMDRLDVMQRRLMDAGVRMEGHLERKALVRTSNAVKRLEAFMSEACGGVLAGVVASGVIAKPKPDTTEHVPIRGHRPRLRREHVPPVPPPDPAYPWLVEYRVEEGEWMRWGRYTTRTFARGIAKDVKRMHRKDGYRVRVRRETGEGSDG